MRTYGRIPDLTPSYVGINAGVSGNSFYSTAGGWTAGVYSIVGQPTVSVSMTVTGLGAGAMVLGLNTSPRIPSSATPLNYDFGLYCDQDAGRYAVLISGQTVVSVNTIPQDGDVMTVNYNGTYVHFTVNGTQLFVAAIPVLNTLLYVAWSTCYANAVTTAEVVPPFPTGYSGLKWVQVETDANGNNDLVWFVTLCQVLLLNLNESPFYATFGIPQQQVVQQGVSPDHYVALTQQYFAPYFQSLIIVKTSDSPPTYEVVAVTHSGVSLTNIVGAVPI